MTLDDVRFWLQMVNDSKRTILCPPDLESRVKGMVDAYGLSGTITVHAHPHIPENQMFIMDEQAIQAELNKPIKWDWKHLT